ncbi:hypothetical protein F442_22370, partial [Phytophthora nicotianae P10297]
MAGCSFSNFFDNIKNYQYTPTMVSLTRVHLTSAAIALVALQLSLATGSPLHEDPITICDSYDLGNKNFPGRGSEIEEDSNCVVIKQG